MTEPPVHITSSSVLAAMSHPTRRRLLDVLAVVGPSMVSTMADRTGLAVGSVSHHLGVLAAAGLVTEAPELARDRREHWWRRATDGVQWSTRDFEGDAAASVVAEAAVSLNLEHHVEKVRAWRARADEASPAWLDAAFASDFWLELTPDELTRLSVELNELLVRWKDRPAPEGGDAREPVFVFAHGIPAAP
jgi:DNA-binding transcriptional ArsR family regulator